MLSQHLCHFTNTPLGENRNLPTHKQKGSSRNAASEPCSSPSGPVHGSQFRSGIQMLSTKHVSCSALWPRGKEHCLLQKRLGRKGCSAHHLPPPLADHQDGPGAPLLTQAGFTTAYTQVSQRPRRLCCPSNTAERTHQQVLLFFFFDHTTRSLPGIDPHAPCALVVRGLNQCTPGEVLSLALNTSQGFQEMGEGVLGLASLSLESSQATQEETTRYCHVMCAS